MKKLLITSCLFCLFGTLSAQTEKGSWIANASSNFGASTTKAVGQSERQSNFNFATSAGYFLADNFTLGLGLGATRTKFRDDKESSISFGLFSRFYPQGKFFIGLGASATFYYDSDFSGSGEEDIVTAEIGYPIWLTDNIAIEPSIYHGFFYKYSDTRFTGMNIGFSLYF